MLPTAGVEHSREELLVAIQVMQCSSNVLSTLVAGKRICKQKKNSVYTVNPFAYGEVADYCGKISVRF